MLGVVAHMRAETDELWLYQKFAPFGALRSCKVKTDPTTGKCRWVGTRLCKGDDHAHSRHWAAIDLSSRTCRVRCAHWSLMYQAAQFGVVSCSMEFVPCMPHVCVCVCVRRGVGFVNYVDQASAMRALQQLDGTRTPEGRQMHITLQAPRAVRAAAAAVSSMPNLTPMLPTSNTPVAHPGLQLPQYTVSPNTHLTQLLATLQLSSANNQALRGQRYPQYGPFTQ